MMIWPVPWPSVHAPAMASLMLAIRLNVMARQAVSHVAIRCNGSPHDGPKDGLEAAGQVLSVSSAWLTRGYLDAGPVSPLLLVPLSAVLLSLTLLSMWMSVLHS